MLACFFTVCLLDSKLQEGRTLFVLLTSGTQKVLNKCWLNKLWINKCLRPDSFLFPILPSRRVDLPLCFQDVPILLQTPLTRALFTRSPLLGRSFRHSSDWRAPPHPLKSSSVPPPLSVPFLASLHLPHAFTVGLAVGSSAHPSLSGLGAPKAGGWVPLLSPGPGSE